MIAINTQVLEKLIQERKLVIDQAIAKRKAAIKKMLDLAKKGKGKSVPKSLLPAQITYLEYLHHHFREIVFANCKSLDKFKAHFDGIISDTQMGQSTHKEFREELLKKMGYDRLRDSLYPELFSETGIRVCIYCNAQYALTVKNIKGKSVAKFQVDHHLPKAKYPCFSISFYNLYPVCGSCNLSKSDGKVIFNLYSDSYADYSRSGFRFALDKASLVKYRVNGQNVRLKVKIEEPDGCGVVDKFSLEGIYEHHRDIAEELVLKSMVYNQAYKDTLKASFDGLYKDKMPMFERLLTGNYTEEMDLHKRPLAKFTQDIAKQLKLI